MKFKKTLFALPMLILFGLLLSISGFSQAATNNNDDEEDEEDFIVIGQPGLKPDTLDRYPGCAKPQNGAFNLWIQVTMSNIDQLDLPCDLVVKAEISRPEEPETIVVLYSQPLQFSCTESDFCKACPDATLCTAYGIFLEPTSKFLPLCNGREGEKINLDIKASVTYSCEGDPYPLSVLESAGCLGYLPESCFKVTDGVAGGTGCLVCPEEIVAEPVPDTIGPSGGNPGPGRLVRNDQSGKVSSLYLSQKATRNSDISLLANPVHHTLGLQLSSEWANPQISIIHSTGQINAIEGISQENLNIDVSRYQSGIYYLLIKSEYKTKVIPWIKI